jgi:hypothetical protein
MKKPWRVVSVASDDVVATIAFRDEEGGLRQAVEEAHLADSWDKCRDILAAALDGDPRPHELSADCWCRPQVERVTP